MLFSVEKGRRKDTLYSSIIKKIHTITIFAGVAMDKKDNKAELLNGVYGSICETIGFENTVKLYQQLKGSQINFPTRLYSKEYVTREATLRLHGRYAMLARERIYGRDQTVTLIDEDTTELRCTMQNEEDIMSFVMGFGSHCEVVSPGWLKDRVKDEARKILSQDRQ